MAGAVVRVSFDLWLQRLEDPRQERSKVIECNEKQTIEQCKKHIMQANFKSRIVEQNI